MAAVFQYLHPIPLVETIPYVKFSFALLGLITLDIDISQGVSCIGMQAPMYLFINYIIIAIVITLFDSSVFLFLRLSPKHFRLPQATFLTRCGLSDERARTIEEVFFQCAIIGAGRNIKTILQFVMAQMIWFRFLPIWDEISDACESKYRFSEHIARYATTACFWVLALPTFNLVIHSAVYGVAPKRIDKHYGKRLDLEEQAIHEYALNPQHKVLLLQDLNFEKNIVPKDLWHRLHSARIPEGYRSNGDTDYSFSLYRTTFTCISRCCSFTKCFFIKYLY